MGLAELFVAVLIAGVSIVNAAVPLAAWSRLHDVRFLLLSAANAVLALLGGLWIWGQLPVNPPTYVQASLPELLLALAVAVLLLLSSLWTRRT